MAVESSTISATVLPQRTAIRRFDLRAARFFSGRDLTLCIGVPSDRGLSADRLDGPPSGSWPRLAKPRLGAGPVV